MTNIDDKKNLTKLKSWSFIEESRATLAESALKLQNSTDDVIKTTDNLIEIEPAIADELKNMPR